MELLIVEDVLLLLLDEKRGDIAGPFTVNYVLGGAVLNDLGAARRVRIEEPSSVWTESTVVVEPGPDLDDPILADALALVDEKVRGTTDVMARLGDRVRDPVLDRLVERGMLERREKKVLGLFPSTSWPEVDGRREADVRDTIRRVIVGGDVPDPRTAAIISLLSAGGVAGQVLTYPDVKPNEVEKRAKLVMEGLAEGGVVRGAAESTNAAIEAAIALAVSTAVMMTITTTTIVPGMMN